MDKIDAEDIARIAMVYTAMKRAEAGLLDIIKLAEKGLIAGTGQYMWQARLRELNKVTAWVGRTYAYAQEMPRG